MIMIHEYRPSRLSSMGRFRSWISAAGSDVGGQDRRRISTMPLEVESGRADIGSSLFERRYDELIHFVRRPVGLVAEG